LDFVGVVKFPSWFGPYRGRLVCGVVGCRVHIAGSRIEDFKKANEFDSTDLSTIFSTVFHVLVDALQCPAERTKKRAKSAAADGRYGQFPWEGIAVLCVLPDLGI